MYKLIEETTIPTGLIFGIQGYFGPGSVIPVLSENSHLPWSYDVIVTFLKINLIAHNSHSI